MELKAALKCLVMNQGRKMSQNDLWEKAVACVKAAHASSDPKRRAILICLGGFWLNLAQVNPVEIDDEMAINIAAAEQMQAELIETSPTLH
jgi:hypothetical protein